MARLGCKAEVRQRENTEGLKESTRPVWRPPSRTRSTRATAIPFPHETRSRTFVPTHPSANWANVVFFPRRKKTLDVGSGFVEQYILFGNDNLSVHSDKDKESPWPHVEKFVLHFKNSWRKLLNQVIFLDYKQEIVGVHLFLYLFLHLFKKLGWLFMYTCDTEKNKSVRK